MPLLLDTGVLYALADRDDDWHARAVTYLASTREILVVPVTVVPEVTHLVRTRLGRVAERAFVGSLAGEELSLEPLSRADLGRSLALLEKYPDIGFVDASVVAMAERLALRTIATTDRRHFSRVRPRHLAAFDLVP